MIHPPKQNRLLAAPPAEVYEHLAPHLEIISLPRGLVLDEPGAAQEYAYFPTSSILFVLNPQEDGASPEVAVIGNDDLAGTALLMGGAATTISRAVVQSAGHAFERMSGLLGVRREGVTGASGNLAAAGLISYRRGCVTVLDRPGLEARVCECYEVVRTEVDRLLPIKPRVDIASSRGAAINMAN